MRFVNHSPENLALELVVNAVVWGDGIILAAGTSVPTTYRGMDDQVHMTISKHDALGKPAIASYSVRGMEEVVTASSTDRSVRTFRVGVNDVVDLYFTFEPIDSVRCRDLTCPYVQSSAWNASIMEHDDIIATSTITPIREPLWKDTPSSNRIGFWNKGSDPIQVDMKRSSGDSMYQQDFARIQVPPGEKRYFLASSVIPQQVVHVKYDGAMVAGTGLSMPQDPVVTGLTQDPASASASLERSYTLNDSVTAGSEVTIMFTIDRIVGVPVANTPTPAVATTDTTTKVVSTTSETTTKPIPESKQSHAPGWLWGFFVIGMLFLVVCVAVIVAWFRATAALAKAAKTATLAAPA